MNTRTLLVLSAMVAGVVIPTAANSQGLAPPGPRSVYKLRLIASYGWEDTRADPRLDKRTAAAGGGVLGRIADLQITPGGSQVVVLDNLYRKVVAFDSAGIPHVLLTWREGKGPGEFTRPRSIAFRAGGFVIVDQGQPRIAFYAQDGTLTKYASFNGSALQVIATPTGYALVRMPFNSRRLVVLLDSAGTPRDSLFPAVGRLAQFTEWGEVGRLYQDRKGAPWFASPAIGVLCPVVPSARCTGTDVLPKVRGELVKMSGQDVPLVRMAIRGAAALGSGETVLLVNRIEQPYHSWLMIMGSSGAYNGYIDLGDGLAARLVRGRGSMEIVLGVTDPYPHVRRYQLQR